MPQALEASSCMCVKKTAFVAAFLTCVLFVGGFYLLALLPGLRCFGTEVPITATPSESWISSLALRAVICSLITAGAALLFGQLCTMCGAWRAHRTTLGTQMQLVGCGAGVGNLVAAGLFWAGMDAWGWSAHRCVVVVAVVLVLVAIGLVAARGAVLKGVACGATCYGKK